jgi:hypothetical protein
MGPRCADCDWGRMANHGHCGAMDVSAVPDVFAALGPVSDRSRRCLPCDRSPPWRRAPYAPMNGRGRDRMAEQARIFQLVGVGASAGGVEALSTLVATFPRAFPAPLVLAQHLDPGRPSHLVEILARRSTLPVRTVSEPCRAWAVWGDPGQRCVNHAGRHHTGPLRPSFAPRRRTRYVPCNCQAYAWPHRPGGGLCRWPEPPVYGCTTPPSTHRWPRWRRS